MVRIRATREAVGPCPYLPERTWVTNAFSTDRLSGALYEQLLSHGWRRSGHTFYQNQCEHCRACVPIRIPVTDFSASKSQRRIVRKNRDISISVLPRTYREEAFRLFHRYEQTRHQPPIPTDREGYRRFLCESAVPGHEMHYRCRDGKLIGVGWIDVMPHSLSTVYFAFDPEAEARSLGTFSILYEIEYAKALGKLYHHLGFYVADSRKMAYKASFFPNDQLVGHDRWQRFHNADDLAARDPSRIGSWQPTTRSSMGPVFDLSFSPDPAPNGMK